MSSNSSSSDAILSLPLPKSARRIASVNTLVACEAVVRSWPLNLSSAQLSSDPILSYPILSDLIRLIG